MRALTRNQGFSPPGLFCLFLAMASTFSAHPAAAENILHPKELKESARRILEREQQSVVWVSAAVKLRSRADGSAVPDIEGRVETRGTVVDASGLTAVSNTLLDAERALAGQPLKLPAGMTRVETKAEFSFLEIVLGDGVAVPADIVYRDQELDLAFLRPDAKIAAQRGAAFRAVNVQQAASLDVMDDVISVSRQDAGMDRTASVAIGNISSVVRGSRTFYQTSVGVPGVPVFGSDGTLLGVSVYRMVDGAPKSLVTLSADTVKIIAEIAEATGFLTAKSEELDASLTEGLTLSLPSLAKPKQTAPAELAVPDPALAPPPPPVVPSAPVPAAEPPQLVVSKVSPARTPAPPPPAETRPPSAPVKKTTLAPAAVASKPPEPSRAAGPSVPKLSEKPEGLERMLAGPPETKPSPPPPAPPPQAPPQPVVDGIPAQALSERPFEVELQVVEAAEETGEKKGGFRNLFRKLRFKNRKDDGKRPAGELPAPFPEGETAPIEAEAPVKKPEKKKAPLPF